MNMTELARRLTHFYADINTESVKQLSAIYDTEVQFIDPVRMHTGLSALQNYFSNLLSNVTHCRFDIASIDTIDNRLFILWKMHYGHPQIAGGKPITLQGTSFLKEQANKVVFQQDYYDMGAMLYEHIPVMGFVVKKLKDRL